MKFRYKDTTIMVNMPDRETLRAEIRQRLHKGGALRWPRSIWIPWSSCAAFRRAYAAMT